MSAGFRARLRLVFAALALASAAPAFAQEPLGRVTRADVEAALPEARAGLPVRIDEVTQVVGIRARGTEFVYDVAISRRLASDEVKRFRREFHTQTQATLCANPDTADFMRRGGSFRHRYSDTTGYRFETRVSRCP